MIIIYIIITIIFITILFINLYQHVFKNYLQFGSSNLPLFTPTNIRIQHRPTLYYLNTLIRNLSNGINLILLNDNIQIFNLNNYLEHNITFIYNKFCHQVKPEEPENTTYIEMLINLNYDDTTSCFIFNLSTLSVAGGQVYQNINEQFNLHIHFNNLISNGINTIDINEIQKYSITIRNYHQDSFFRIVYNNI